MRSVLLVLVFGCSGPIERLEATSLDRLGAEFAPTRRATLAVDDLRLRIEASWHQATLGASWLPPKYGGRGGHYAVWLLDARGAVVDHQIFGPECERPSATHELGVCESGWRQAYPGDGVVEVMVTAEAGHVWLAMPTGPIVARVPLARISRS